MNPTRRVLLFGARGQVGGDVLRILAPDADVFAPARDVADLGQPSQVRDVVRAYGPSVIVNAAAYTAVDRAESERVASHAINAVAPGVMAEEARRLGALLVHFSTDYVFDGAAREPYTEASPAAPLSIYGATKLEGERRVLDAAGTAVILRTSWVYGPTGSNFLLTMRRLMNEREEVRVVDDQWGAPTSAAFLARATRAVLDAPDAPGGVYHVTAAGATTWCRFARSIHARLVARGPLRCRRIVAIPTAAYPTPARRPAYSVLDCGRFVRTFSLSMEPWEALLDDVIARLT